MLVPPRPWKSLSDGGYLVTLLNLLKRQPTASAKQLIQKANMTMVLSAVNAIQNTTYRINQKIHRIMQEARDAGYLFFGLPADTYNKTKGAKKMVDLCLAASARLLRGEMKLNVGLRGRRFGLACRQR